MLEDSLKSFLRSYLTSRDLGDDNTTRYSFAVVRLHDEATQQVIVYVSGANWCGSGGCTLFVLTGDASSYRVIGRTPITRLPIRILASKTKGWHDIGVWVQGGGVQPGYEAALPFDGNQYPGNPSVPLARQVKGRVDGEVVISSNPEENALYGWPSSPTSPRRRSP
jgi:hypothetical protein